MVRLSVDATALIGCENLGRIHLILQENELSLDLPQGTQVSVQYSQIVKYGLNHEPDQFKNCLYVEYAQNKEGGSSHEEACILLCFDTECVLLRTLEMLMQLVDADVHHLTTQLSEEPLNGDSTFGRPCHSGSASRVTTLLLKTHVTCIQFYGGLLLAGIGGTLQVFKKGGSYQCWTLLVSQRIFRGQHIHGIRMSSNDYFVVYGGRKVSLLRFRKFGVLGVSLVYSFQAPDWVLGCSWLEGKQIALLTANNALLLYNLSIHEPDLASVHHCSERCILYSGLILGNTWNDIVVLAGTVFSTIVIWSNSGEDPTKEVIHRLEGHKGVIFSVNFCHKNRYICSTSDDRTVRVWSVEFEQPYDWKKCTIALRFSLYGHSARVWKSSLLETGGVVSVGEDSRICLWNPDGTLETHFNGHQDGEIWSLDVSEELQLIATGGSDGGISLWPMKKAPFPQVLDSLQNQHTNSKPKCVGLTKDGRPFMVSWNGDIYLFCASGWNLCLSEPELRSYCIHAITPDRQFVAFASITGRIMICQFSGSDSLQKVVDAKVCEGRIFSLVWTSSSSIGICGTCGQFAIWELSVDCWTLRKEVDLVLPHSKERWTTSCATYGNYVVCGDRCGSLYLYRKDGKTKDPVYIAKKIHGPNGVTDVRFLLGNFVSTGRDGKYREFGIINDKLIMLRCCKLKLDWAAAVCETNLLGRVMFCFQELYFIIWSIKERQPVVKIDCGGGHRSWDCAISDEQQSIVITFIKGKSVHYCSIPIRDVLCHSLVPGTHPKAINCADFVALPWKGAECDQLIILGGEDTTLRLTSVKTDSQTELRILQSHLSSVRAVACHLSEFNNILYIGSGGGRGQLVLWKVLSSPGQTPDVVELNSYSVMSGKDNDLNDAAEMRIMDLQVYQCSSESVMIAAGCSDGMLRIFDFSVHSNGVREVQAIDCKHCLLNVRVIHGLSGRMLFMTTTGGVLLGHSILNSGLLAKDEPNHRFSISQTGINSCDYREIDGHLIVSCAGDDAIVNFLILTLNPSSNLYQITDKCSFDAAHTCQVSGLKMVDNLLFTAGLDQKLTIFSWSVSGTRIKAEIITVLDLCIPDIHGILVWKCPDKKSVCIFVHGLGTELLEFSLENVPG